MARIAASNTSVMPRPLDRLDASAFKFQLANGLSFISICQLRKVGTFYASELVGIEPTPLASEEQGMPAFAKLSTRLL